MTIVFILSIILVFSQLINAAGCPKGKRASGQAVNVGGTAPWSKCNTGYQVGKASGFLPPNTPNPCGNPPTDSNGQPNPGGNIQVSNNNIAVAVAIGSAHDVGDAKCKTNNNNNNCKCSGVSKVSVSRTPNGFVAKIVGKCVETTAGGSNTYI